MTADIGLSSPDRTQPSFRANLLLALVYLLVVLVAHGGSYRGEFVFDDTGSIVENASIHKLFPLSQVLTDARFTTVAGRPLLNLSLALNYALCGLHPEGYHLVNYVIHAANAFLLMLLLHRLFASFAATQSAAVAMALSISLLWCIHPLTINGVSYICQRAETLTSGFYLLVLWAALKGMQSSQTRWLGLSVLAAWLGGLTKEIIATVPIAVMAMDVLLVTRDWRRSLRLYWRYYLALMSSWLPLGVCMWASKARAGTVGFGMGITLGAHLQTQLWALAMYLKKVIWPLPLVFDYGDRFVVTDASQVLPAAVVVASFGALVLWLLVRRSPLAFLGVMPLLLLAPTLVIPIATQTVAEHRMYLASACIITAVVLASYLALARLPRLAAATPTSRLAAFCVVWIPVAAMLLLVTVRHTRILLTSESLWTDTVRKQPTSQRAVYSLASAKFNAKRDDHAAERLCSQAIAMPGNYVANAYEVRGRIFGRQGKTQQALEDFTSAIMIHPRGKYCVVSAYGHRAAIYAEQREFQKALDDFSKAIELRPKEVKYLYGRTITLRDMGRYDEALRDLDKALKIDPLNVNTDLVRASIEVAQGEFEQALRSFDRLLTIEPNHVGARQRRVWVYAQLNRWQDAMREIQRLQDEGQRINAKLVEQVTQHLASQTP